MRLVDEEDDRSGRRCHFLDHGLQTIFELTLDAGPGLQQSQIECANRDVLQRRRDISRDDSQRESFDHGGLPDTRFAGQDRIVLPAAHQDVDNLAQLVVATQHRIDLTLPGALRQIDGELVERWRRGGSRCFRPVGPSTSVVDSDASSVLDRT